MRAPHISNGGRTALVLALVVAAGISGASEAGAEVESDDIVVLGAGDADRYDRVALGDGELRRAVTTLERERAGEPDRVVAESILVEVVSGSSPDDIVALVEALGGSVSGAVPGEIVEASVPLDRLVELEAEKAVEFVRRPLEANVALLGPSPTSTSVGPIVGEEVFKTNADAWHPLGIDGTGVAVGIVDGFNGTAWTAAQSAGEVPAPTGTFCRWEGVICDLWSHQSNHGVGVAEIVHEMAPGAAIYLATVNTTSDLQAAIDWFDAVGVDIISRSLTAEYDGPGDGTGPVDAVLDDAVAAGMTWFNAAGNSAGGAYWRGEWRDENSNGFLDFNAPGDPIDETLGVVCLFTNGLRWNDWGTDKTDYDMYEVVGGVATAIAYDDQAATAPPLEHPEVCDGAVHHLAIGLYDMGGGTSGDSLEFMVNQGVIEYWSDPFSAAQPAADTANPGGMAVGAVDPPLGTDIASYSSRGPTNDVRVKPDVSAASCVLSMTYDTCFDGTSAATPVVAGAAALVLSRFPSLAPHQLTQWLSTNATVDRGDIGPDNDHGVGELTLPTVPGPPISVVATAGDFEASVTWSAPASDGGLAISGYTATSTHDGHTCSTGGTRTCTVTGLTAGATYTFAVTATNSIGTGPPSAPSAPVTIGPIVLPPAPPVAVDDVSSVDQGGSVTIDVVANDASPGGYAIEVSEWSDPDHGTLTHDGFGRFTYGHDGSMTYSDSFTYQLSNGTSESAPATVRITITGVPVMVTMNPVRVHDSRSGPMPAAGSITRVQVAGVAGVPADADAVMLNVTAVRAQGWGFVTVYPCGSPLPVASNLNYVAGQTTPNAVVAKPGTTGTVCLYTYAATHLLVDINGYAPHDSGVATINPVRVHDSRSGPMPAAGSITGVQVAGVAGVPADADAVMLNVTAVRAQGWGFVTVYPCGSPLPVASNLNYVAGQTTPNAVVAKPGTTGTVCLYTYAATHLLVDINGYAPHDSGVATINPVRVHDSRSGPMPAAGSITGVQVAGVAGVPADADAVMLNVTAVRAQGWGFVTVYPCGSPLPVASNLNYVAGQTTPNAVVAKPGTTGTVCLYTYAATHLLVDINGYAD